MRARPTLLPLIGYALTLLLGLHISAAVGMESPPREQWLVSRFHGWTRLQAPVIIHSRKATVNFYSRETAHGEELYVLDYYRPSRQWTPRPFLRVADEHEVKLVIGHIKGAVRIAGRASPPTGIFIRRGAWPQVNVASFTKGSGVASVRARFDFTFRDGHDVTLLSDYSVPSVIMLYDGGCLACADNITPFVKQSQEFINRTHGRAFIVTFANFAEVRSKVQSLDQNVDVVDGRSLSFATALAIRTMPRTYLVTASGEVVRVISGTTPDPLLTVYAEQVHL